MPGAGLGMPCCRAVERACVNVVSERREKDMTASAHIMTCGMIFCLRLSAFGPRRYKISAYVSTTLFWAATQGASYWVERKKRAVRDAGDRDYSYGHPSSMPPSRGSMPKRIPEQLALPDALLSSKHAARTF